MKIFTEHRADLINFVAIVAFFIIAFALDGIFSDNPKNAEVSKPEAVENTAKADAKQVSKDTAPKPASENAIYNDKTKQVKVEAQVAAKAPEKEPEETPDAKVIEQKPSVAEATPTEKSKPEDKVAATTVASEKAAPTKSTPPDVRTASKPKTLPVNTAATLPRAREVKSASEMRPTDDDKNFPVELLDTDAARRQYMAANKGIKTIIIEERVGEARAVNVGSPSLSAEAAVTNDDFIPFEKHQKK